MIRHIVLTRFENPSEQAPIAAEKLRALAGVIPEVVSLETGPDVTHSERSYDLALIVTFRTREDLERYGRHPAHEAARAYIKAHRTASASADFEF